MSGNPEDNKQTPTEGKKGETVKILLDPSPQVEELRKQLENERKKSEEAVREAEKKLAEAEAKRQVEIQKAIDDKKAAEEAKKALEQEKEDYKNKLDLIAEKEFIAKRSAILERAKKDFVGNEAKYKDIEAKLSDPEKGPQELARTEFLLQTVEEAIAGRNQAIEQAQAEARKADEARRQAELAIEGKKPPVGGETARLDSGESKKPVPASNGSKYMPNFSAQLNPTDQLIAEQYAIKNSPNSTPQQKAQAESTIKQLMTRAAMDYKEKFRKRQPFQPELVEKHSDGVDGYSPYNKREEIKTFREMKKSGV